MEIDKSSRHSKIIGNFGESLVCNWLSRSGFETAIIDHTGIDIIAFNPKFKQRLGISVKSRTRKAGTESESVNIIKREKRHLISEACNAFSCEEWLAIYVEATNEADLYMTSFENYESKYLNPEKKMMDWKMSENYVQKYKLDDKVHHIHLKFQEINWNF
jgi:Holliday junction resolvase-like predicted endonuclease